MIERRFCTGVRSLESPDADSLGTIVGYASVFNSYSEDLGGFRELVMPGAFDRSLASGADVKALLNHDPNLLLGRTKSGTLQLSTDAMGLRAAINLPKTSAGRDAWESIKRGDMSEMSFAFTVDSDEWGEDNDPDDRSKTIPVRRLRQVKLMDVSAVTYPAYKATSINVSSKQPFFNSLARSLEQLFPTGIPVEVRSRMSFEALSQLPGIVMRREQVRTKHNTSDTSERERRQRLTDLVLGL